MTISTPKTIRVLIVDDSPLIQKILSRGLGQDPALEVVGVAGDPYQARDLIVKLNPDVMTLDIEMPRMTGLEFLRKLMPSYPLPVIMVSTLSQEGAQITLDCLAAGAMDFVCKPSAHLGNDATSMLLELRSKIRVAVRGKLLHPKKFETGKEEEKKTSAPPPSPVVIPRAPHLLIALGASTGGTEAIRQVLKQLPPQIPGMAIVQHMPPGFTKAYADRLNGECALNIREAETGDYLRPGTVLIAPGGLHMTIRRESTGYRVTCQEGEKVNWHCPSVDVMMHSVAAQAGKHSYGIMLTGMGHDGAQGMLAMRKAGARTMAQNEATSVVFGMPKVAHECGGAERLVPLERIPAALLELLSGAPAHD